MRKFALALLALGFVFPLASPSFGQQDWLTHRFQLEGSFATLFNGDAGYNLNLNYSPPLPGELDKVVSIGGFWQWTFDADNLIDEVGGENPDVMKLGGEIRFQKAFSSFVPYVKGEASWVRFDADFVSSVDKFGIGPGAGLNFWIARNVGLGAEVNTVFLFDRDDSPKKQLTTFMVRPRIRF